MNFVYPLGSGSIYSDFELALSVYLLRKYCDDVNVVVVGSKPRREIKDIVFIEPCKEAFEVVSKIQDENVICINVACGAEEGEIPMYVSHQNQGQSNSLLEPKLHLQQHPEVVFDDAEAVKVVRLDNLPIEKEKYDMLAMDVQGFEGEVLKGATETLKHIKLIYTEVNRGQTYSGNMEIEEIDSLLGVQGFKRVETFWPSPNWTWGDAVYIKI